MSIRALIVDDHPVTREGLRTALELSEDAVVVVGEAGSGEEAVEQAATSRRTSCSWMSGCRGWRHRGDPRIREASPETKIDPDHDR